MFKRDCGKNGLTIVEALLSIIILTVVLCGVLTAFIVGKEGVLRVRHRIAVKNVLRARMETLKNAAYDSIVSAGPVTVTMDIGPDLTQGTVDDLEGSRTITVIDRDGYKEISLTLSWTEGRPGSGITVSETVVTFVTIWSIYQ